MYPYPQQIINHPYPTTSQRFLFPKILFQKSGNKTEQNQITYYMNIGYTLSVINI